jgi:hypothetical protein
MRIVRGLLLLVAAWCSCIAATDIKTLSIRVPEGHDDVTYDADRVRLEDLKHWLTLSPVLSQNNNVLYPEEISACYVDDPAYEPCAGHSIWLNAANAAHSQQRIRDRLSRLKRDGFQPDFWPIIDYLRTVQSFGLWVNQQQIEFFRTKSVPLLESKYPALHINPKASCSTELDSIRKSTDEISEWSLVIFEWHNCVWKQFTAAAGSYPQAVWEGALKSRGIREHLVVDEDQK